MEEFRRELVKIALESLLSNTEVMKVVSNAKRSDGKPLNMPVHIARLSVDCADEVINMMYRR